MAAPRFFAVDELDGSSGDIVSVPLATADLRHARDALRLRRGDEIIVVSPQGVPWRCEVVGVGSDGLQVELDEPVEVAWEPRVTLVQGIGKGSKVDAAVQGAVEVGAEAVLPTMFARDVVRLDEEKRRARAGRWQRVAHAAAKQAQRAFVPYVDLPRPIDDRRAELAEFDAVVVAWEEETARTVGEALADVAADARVAVVVGPEGGLSGDEIEALRSMGARTVTLGPSVLRTETAGVVSTALVIAAMRERGPGIGCGG